MEKRFTQTGTFSNVVCGIMVIVGLILVFAGHPGTLWPGILLVIVALLIASICYKLTITVTASQISFAMGLGFIHRTYDLSELESCTVVRNKVLNGIGIRFYPDGMLYNVSGLQAVELAFRGKKMRVRIGTDQPEEVCRVVNQYR